VADEELAGRRVTQRFARLPAEGEFERGGGQVAVQRGGEIAPGGEARIDLDEAVLATRAVGFDEFELERAVPAQFGDERLRDGVELRITHDHAAETFAIGGAQHLADGAGAEDVAAAVAEPMTLYSSPSIFSCTSTGAPHCSIMCQ
jgi:hypothetical protein